MRQGSRFIIRSNNFNIVSLSMRKLAKMGCRIWADIESPRVNQPAPSNLSELEKFIKIFSKNLSKKAGDLSPTESLFQLSKWHNNYDLRFLSGKKV